MVTIRKAADRGHFDHGWLNTYHSFSFADYYDPQHMGFRSLRVLNEDRVEPGQGFPTHAHRDMEILTYVLEGALEHRDSMGNGSVLRPGEVQRMSAGTGVMHSEYNPSQSELVHLLQIWILPDRKGVAPSYEQKAFSDAEKRGRIRLVASREGREGSVTIHQDTDLYLTALGSGQEIFHSLRRGRHAWVQIARGSVKLNGQLLAQGDAASISGEEALRLTGVHEAEALVFDLA